MNMKVIPVIGNQLQIKYRPINQEFQNKTWFIKLLSASFESQVEFQNNVVISCNFVTSEMYSQSGQIVTYEQPLQVFFLKLGLNGKNSFRFNDNNWFQVNSSAFELNFSITDTERKEIRSPLKVMLVFAIRQQ